MYYIKNGLGKNWQWLAFFYSLFGVLTVFGTGNATQVNTITTAIDYGSCSVWPDLRRYGNVHAESGHWYLYCHAGGNGPSRRHQNGSEA